MNYKKWFLIVCISIILSGCVNKQKIDMQLHNYSEPIISMELNHAKTVKFCQDNGYAFGSHQWIIGDEHSGFVGQRIGYDIYGMDGSFNADDLRVHVDCVGIDIQKNNYSIQDVYNWLIDIKISNNSIVLNNNTYDYFCQQKEMNFEKIDSNYITCYNSYEARKEYTPQEIARWYILKKT